MAYTDNEYSAYDLEGAGMKVAAGALAGLVVGGLIGAAIMMIYAPQSGAKTRKMLRKKAMALRNQASETEGKGPRPRRRGAGCGRGARARGQRRACATARRSSRSAARRPWAEQKERVTELVGNNKHSRFRR